ncbi:Uncharacterised protein [uncultured archaeon]|nr:Uncharacterised protein [uncultured archaeon]
MARPIPGGQVMLPPRRIPEQKPIEEQDGKATLSSVMGILDQRASARNTTLTDSDKALLTKFHTPFKDLSDEIERRKKGASGQELNQLKQNEKLDILMKFYSGDNSVSEILPNHKIFTVVTGDEAERLESIYKEKLGINLNVNFLPEDNILVRYYNQLGWGEKLKTAAKSVGDFIKDWYFSNTAIQLANQWVAETVRKMTSSGGAEAQQDQKEQAFANIQMSRIGKTDIEAAPEQARKEKKEEAEGAKPKSEEKSAEFAKAEAFFDSIFEGSPKYGKLMNAENVDFKTQQPKNFVFTNFTSVMNEKFGTPPSQSGDENTKKYVYDDFTVQMRAEKAGKFTKFTLSRTETAAKAETPAEKVVEMPAKAAAKSVEPAAKPAVKQGASAPVDAAKSFLKNDVGLNDQKMAFFTDGSIAFGKTEYIGKYDSFMTKQAVETLKPNLEAVVAGKIEGRGGTAISSSGWKESGKGLSQEWTFTATDKKGYSVVLTISDPNEKGSRTVKLGLKK